MLLQPHRTVAFHAPFLTRSRCTRSRCVCVCVVAVIDDQLDYVDDELYIYCNTSGFIVALVLRRADGGDAAADARDFGAAFFSPPPRAVVDDCMASLCALSGLRVLDLHNVRCRCAWPTHCAAASTLRRLRVSHASLRGRIAPTTFAAAAALERCEFLAPELYAADDTSAAVAAAFGVWSVYECATDATLAPLLPPPCRPAHIATCVGLAAADATTLHTLLAEGGMRINASHLEHTAYASPETMMAMLTCPGWHRTAIGDDGGVLELACGAGGGALRLGMARLPVGAQGVEMFNSGGLLTQLTALVALELRDMSQVGASHARCVCVARCCYMPALTLSILFLSIMYCTRLRVC